MHAYWVFGPGGSDIRLKTDTRLLASGQKLKRYTLIDFLWFYYVFLDKGPRAQRAEKFEAMSYTLKNICSVIEIRA